MMRDRNSRIISGLSTTLPAPVTISMANPLQHGSNLRASVR